MELAETGGSFSREELILVEVVPSPDLRREYSEAERFRVGFFGFWSDSFFSLRISPVFVVVE